MINRLYKWEIFGGLRGFAPRREGGGRPRSGLKPGGDFPLLMSFFLYQPRQYSVKLSHYVLYDFIACRCLCDYCF